MAADWRVVYLRALGAKPTPGALAFLSHWQPYEGGHTNNSARFNYLNTTQKMPGSSSINSVGVQSYKTLAQGAQAFAKTLLGMSQYAGLVRDLRSGDIGSGASAGLQTWVSGSPTGNPGYAQKVLGSAASVPETTVTGTEAPGMGPGSPNATGGPTAAQQAIEVGKQIRQAAVGSLHDIAGGMTPTKSFGDLAGMIKQLKAVTPAFQAQAANGSYKPAPQGDGSLEAQAVSLAKGYQGVDYVWGGEDPKTGFDCSGLVQYVWKQFGVKLPRTTYDQWDAGQPVGQGQLKPGDAVFFTGSDPRGGKPGHEGMYIGNGKFIEAPGRGKVVRISTLKGRSDFVGARRFA